MPVQGPSAKLPAQDKRLQEYVSRMQKEGIIVKACKACAEMYDVSEHLYSYGLDVQYMDVEFTDNIKER